MIFEASNLFVILIIAGVVGISSFAWYFPLVLIWRKGGHILALTIPLSLSIEILFGYVFYSAELTHEFPLWYAIFVVLLNGYAIVRLWQLGLLVWPKLVKPQWWQCLLGSLAVLGPLLYTRFYDAFVYIAPGNNDTYNHIFFLNDFERVGYLSSPFYAPGFHIILYPLKLLINDADLYRFTGPVLGVLAVLAIYLLLRDRWQHRATHLVWLLLMTFPVYNQLTLQTISFFPSALTFIFFAGFLYLATTPTTVPRRIVLWSYAIISIALALTVPYLFVQYIPLLVLYTLLIWWRKRDFTVEYSRTLIRLCCISVLALGIGIGHVFFQTRIIRYTIDAFPEIPIVENNGNQISIRSNYKTADDYKIIESATNRKKKTNKNNINAPIAETPSESSGLVVVVSDLWTMIKQKPFISQNVLPIFEVALELLRVKNVRPLNSLLGIGSYVWILVACGLLWYGIKRRSPWLTLLALSSIVFGISTQTGILELSYYRGRSGWYLMFLSQLGALAILDTFYRPRYRWAVYALIGALYKGSLLSPPVFYRPYYTEPFTVAKQIELQHPGEAVHFITNIWQLVMVSNHFTTAPLAIGSMQNAPDVDERYLVIEKTFFPVDPMLSQQAYSTDVNFTEFQARQQALQDSVDAVIAELETLPEFSEYSVYWENESLVIYRWQPQL